MGKIGVVQNILAMKKHSFTDSNHEVTASGDTRTVSVEEVELE